MIIQAIKDALHDIRHGTHENAWKYGIYNDADEMESDLYEREEELAYLECLQSRRREIDTILTEELKSATPKRKVSILTKLNTNDKASWKDNIRINELKED